MNDRGPSAVAVRGNAVATRRHTAERVAQEKSEEFSEDDEVSALGGLQEAEDLLCVGQNLERCVIVTFEKLRKVSNELRTASMTTMMPIHRLHL